MASLGMCSHREPIIAARCAFKELRIVFPVGSTLREFEETARTLDRGHVHPEVMVGEVIGLEELPAKIEALRSGTQNLKVHVEPARDAGSGRLGAEPVRVIASGNQQRGGAVDSDSFER